MFVFTKKIIYFTPVISLFINTVIVCVRVLRCLFIWGKGIGYLTFLDEGVISAGEFGLLLWWSW